MEFRASIAENASLLPAAEGWTVERARPHCALAISDAVEGPFVVFTQHRHDGAHMYTHGAIAVVVKQAEAFAADQGGSWEVSPLLVAHRLNHPEFPKWQDEIVALAMRPLAASPHDYRDPATEIVGGE
jgi:hypothetical protein